MPDVVLRADAFKFKNLSRGFFSEILACSREELVEAVHISQCPLTSVTFELTSDYLVLLMNAKIFGDSAVKVIGEADTQLTFLGIENYANLSPQALKDTFQAQRLNADAENDDVVIDRKAIALSHLSVRGHGQTLTPEEDCWFQRNTSSITWIPAKDHLTDSRDGIDERAAGRQGQRSWAKGI
ncbi:hypothetical protein Hypma_000425 [Hypsizygus marmoreus]|uniref:Uncharacterized protein n=1 Tax=Hypsizygus marmoreus TaxID=39966 RepID=A0A369JAV0_HYPMA|nr:hypothetical protein Hypma_000425 [Hypsizygus marmoreus]